MQSEIEAKIVTWFLNRLEGLDEDEKGNRRTELAGLSGRCIYHNQRVIEQTMAAS